MQPQIQGIVPQYEEREAARFSLIPWDHYLTLPLSARGGLVAYLRLHRLIDLHQHAAVQASAERAQRQARMRSGTGRQPPLPRPTGRRV